MNLQTVNTSLVPLIQRFARRPNARRRAVTKSSEIALGLVLFVLALVLLLWLQLYFGVPVTSGE
jgi:protein-S-isoprenylcysteine O-methyltransferase Ste14